MASASLRFSAIQKSKLTRDGLLPEQIAALEQKLPWIQTWIEPQPRLADVRARFEAVAKPLRKALRKFQELECAAGQADTDDGPSIKSLMPPASRGRVAGVLSEAAAWEAYDYLVTIGGDRKFALLMSEVAKGLVMAEKWLGTRDQSRVTASFTPIKIIVSALQAGFIRHHESQGLGVVQTGEGDGTHNPLPPYTPLTVSPSGPFFRIARICFDAVGARGPTESIREYQRWRKRLALREIEKRREINEDPATQESEKYRPVDLEFAPRKRGRPKKKMARR